MLKHTENETEASFAAKVRVTPEELAAAVAVLEARKQGASGTIAIGDAVDELLLDSSPSDILREVETRREQQAGKRKKKKLTVQYAWSVAVIALTCGGLALSPTHHTSPRRTAAVAPWFTLSGVPDEQQVYVDTPGLEQIVGGQAPAQIPVYKSSQGIRWGVIKHSGKVYVQGYALQMSEKHMQGRDFDLYNAEDADITGREKGYIVRQDGKMMRDVKIILAIQTFSYDDAQQEADRARITVCDVHTDSHLWDNFEHGR